MIIDIHSHFHPPRMIEELVLRTGIPMAWQDDDGVAVIQYGPSASYPVRPAMTDLGAKIASMDEAGIDAAVLSVTMPGVDGFGTDASRVAEAVNDQLAEMTDPCRQRLGWMCVLPMDDPTSAAAEFKRAVALGARGAMVFSNVAGRELDLDVDQPLFEAACDLDVPLMLHPTYPLAAAALGGFELLSSLGYLVDTSAASLRLVLSGLFARYPDLKFVISHAGSLLPYQAGRIDYQALNRPGGVGPIAGRPSDHVRKLYTDSVCLSPPTLRFATDFFGADRIMMGTDHPQWPMDAGIETLAATDLDARERRLVESEVAQRVFGWPT